MIISKVKIYVTLIFIRFIQDKIQTIMKTNQMIPRLTSTDGEFQYVVGEFTS